MPRLVFIGILLGLLMAVVGQSPSSTFTELPAYAYYPPQQDKPAWQRLNLLLSSTFINVANEGQVDLDSSLYIASRSLGLGRFSILAQGIDNPELLQQSSWIDRRDPGNGIRLLSTATGKKRVEVLLLLGSYYAFEPQGYHRYSDSVDYFLTRAIAESKLLKEAKLERQALCLLGKIYIQANEKKGDSIYNLLIDQCRVAGDKETAARALVYRSRYTPPTLNTLQQKIDDSQRAADIYKHLGNSEGLIAAMIDLGYLLTITGQAQLANDILLKAYNEAKAIRYPYAHYITGALSTVTMFQGKFGEPLGYTLQTIKVAEYCRDSLVWGYYYSQYAALLQSEGRQKESIEMAYKSINRFVIDQNPAVYNMLIGVVGYMGEQGSAKEALEFAMDISKKVKAPTTFTDQYFYHNAFATAYLNLHQFDSAEMHVKKMDSFETKAEAIRGPLRKHLVRYLYADIFYRRGEYDKAKKYLEQYFNTSSSLHTLADDLHIYQLQIRIDSALGNKQSEVSHYKKYIQLLDSSFKVTKLRQAEELQVLYQTQEKEHQIASLTRQTALEKANAKQSALVKKLALAGIIAVVIIAGLLYWQNRLKQKNNKVITASNKQITLKNEQLEQLLADKEWLLKEIHHRVKNNLQIIMSLLNSQSEYIDNEAAVNAIHDSRHRLHAIALIHQKLYQSENISLIAMPAYIKELVSYLTDSFDTGNRVDFEQAVEPVSLDVSQAILLGLIINESVVNAIKYAFPGNRKGMVSIRLQHTEPGEYLLTISDNGIGLPAGFDIKEHNSLGLDLMKGLTKQLKGSFAMKSTTGVEITVRFMQLKR